MKRRAAIRVACVAFVFSVVVCAAQVRAQQYDLDKLLVGKWRQVVGPFVNTTIFTAKHTYIVESVQRGTPYRLYVEGTWEIRNNNQLWQKAGRRIPEATRLPEWQATVLQIIDANHLKNNQGDVYRVQ